MRRFIPFIILIVVILLYVKPFFGSGFFATHDGEWAIIRLAEMQRELKDLQIPPRWSDYLNHGFGYPLFSYTYPGPFYAGTILRVFKIGLTDTVKIIFIGSVAISALFMFLLGRELAGDFAGLVSAIFYIIAPFRLVDLYIRGSIGESVSLALFPLLFYLSIKYILRPSVIKMVLCSMVLAFTILSHNIMAIVFFPFFIIFLYVIVITYFEDIKLYSFRYFLPMILLGLGLASYFFVPALLEKYYIILSKIKLANISENFINLPDYLISPWSYGPKPSFQLGWAHILSIFLSIIAFITAKSIDKKKYLPIAIFIICSIVVLIFFAHPYSAEFWNIPPFSFIDFPWRLLTPLAFFTAFISIFLTLHRFTRVIGGVLIFLTVFLSLPHAKPNEYIHKPDIYYATNDATTTSKDELMPIWVSEKPTVRYKDKVELEKQFGTISEIKYNSKSINFRVASPIPNSVKINTIYFPIWKFFANGHEIPIDFNNSDGLIRLNIPVGSTQIDGYFKETPVRLISDYISLLSMISIVALLGYSLVINIRTRFAKAS